MQQLHPQALCVGIYNWSLSYQNDKTTNSVALSKADLRSVCSQGGRAATAQ